MHAKKPKLPWRGAKDSTRVIVLAALQADESVSNALRDMVMEILSGAISAEAEENLQSVTMSEAARRLGRSRTWFWERVKREGNMPGAAFPPVEISPGEYRYRVRDLEAFAARTVPYAPKAHLENKKSKGEK